MCPDFELLSVFLDGELPSPWKEKMQAHIDSCPICLEKLHSITNVSKLFQKDAEQVDCTEAQDRVRLNLQAYRIRKDQQKERFPLASKTVTIPLPLAIAAALVLLLTSVLALRPSMQIKTGMPYMATQQETLPSMDIPSVLRLLEAREGGEGVLLIQLPSTQTFTPLGEPTLLKAKDYRRRSPRP